MKESRIRGLPLSPLRNLGRGLVVIGVGLLIAAASPTGARAAECTDTWKGGVESTWQTASNWSAGHVPGSSDVACIGKGSTAVVSSAGNEVGIVQGEGGLTLSGGSLAITSTSEASTIAQLSMKSSGTLTGAGTINVASTLSWINESTMSGSGSTVLLSGATATTTLGGKAKLVQRRFVNEGTFTTTSGTLAASEGGSFVNTGTFQKVNTGTTEVQMPFENQGLVEAQKGTFTFKNGGSSTSSGQWKASAGASIRLGGGSYALAGGTLAGPVFIEGTGTTVTTEGVSASSAEVELSAGLIVSTALTVNKLTMKTGASVTGAATLNINGTFTWANESTMSGSGSTVLLPGATGSTTLGGSAKLKQRQFVNEGTLTTTSGTLVASEGGSFLNIGTFQKVNTGTTNVQTPFENKGIVKAEKGSLAFKNGGSSNSTNQWKTTEGGSIGFAAGSYALTNGSLSGSFVINGTTTSVSLESVGASSAQVEVETASFSVLDSATLASLTMKSNATVTGAGTLNISGTFTWANESTMSGSGSTVLPPGATGSTTLGGSAKLKQRQFVNEGTLTISTGTLTGSNGAVVYNRGTLNDNAGVGNSISTTTGEFHFVNTGTFRRTSETSVTEIEVPFENKGVVDAKTGALLFKSGGSSSGSNQWNASAGASVRFISGAYSLSGGSLSGLIMIEGTGTTVSVEGVGGSSGEVELSAALSVLSTTTVNKLTMKSGAALDGAGTLNISGAFTWANESTMSGSGSTVLLSGATGSTTLGGSAKLKQRQFVNEGTLTTTTGTFVGSEGGKFVNYGTFQKVNTGTTQVQALFENRGTVYAESGTISFVSGGSSSGSNQWSAASGALVQFATGSYSLSGGTLAGPIEVEGGSTTATLEGVGGSSGELKIASAGTVTVNTSTTVSKLTMGFNASLKGSGTLNISNNLNWANESTMYGPGDTVILPSATASTTLGGSAELSGRTLINQGTFSVDSGTLVGSGVNGVFVNLGTFQNAGSESIEVLIPFENQGVVRAKNGTGLDFESGGSSAGSNQWNAGEESYIGFDWGFYDLAGGSLSGEILVEGSETTLSLDGVNASAANVDVYAGTFKIQGAPTVAELLLKTNAKLTGAGTLHISKEFNWVNESTMQGSGTTVLLPGAHGVTTLGGTATLEQRRVINEGHFEILSGSIEESAGARIYNYGTFTDNSSTPKSLKAGAGETYFINSGIFQKTVGLGVAEVEVPFKNDGVIQATAGSINILHPVTVAPTENYSNKSTCGDPVDCASGDFAETQTDLAIGGRGIGLNLARSYSAQSAVTATSPGPFGYGWTSSFSDHVVVEKEGQTVTVVDGQGHTEPFEQNEGSFAGPLWSQDELAGNSSAGYTLTRPNQVKMHFAPGGRLETIIDRNGNETALAYDEGGRLETVADPAGRTLKFSYNTSGQVKSVEDPMGHLVTYSYEGGNLSGVTLPGSSSPRWQFKYDGSHRVTSMIDGRGGMTTNEYDSANRVVSQTDPAKRTLTFEYESFHTKITSLATGAVTDEWFNSNNQPYSITHGYGTAAAATETFTYDGDGRLASVKDADNHLTTYGYDGQGNRIREVNAEEEETTWSYDERHDVISMTTPKGEKTTIARDANGNPESISRPAPGGGTQLTSYEYGSHGELESVADPLGQAWAYEYDGEGDRTAAIDPAGDRRSWTYDKDSRVTSMVSPRGNEIGAKSSEFTTTIERDALGRPITVTDPLGGVTAYAYDANGNLASVTDANGNETTFSYNADNERTEVRQPKGVAFSTSYDGAGRVISQGDEEGKTTTYVRNVLEDPIEVIDPLGRRTTQQFDGAGNLISETDAEKRETTYTYDAANRLAKVSYSDGVTPTAEFAYDEDGNLTRMTDGTGESSFSYDLLGRLIEAEDGHGDVVKYAYNLGNQQTGITYPNGKGISRTFDEAGRLASVTDWLGATTTFSYDRDSRLTGIAFPEETGNVDEYTYDHADRMSEASMTQSSKVVVALSYARNPIGQIESVSSMGLPGPETELFGYDEDGRLTKAGSASFGYDSANNLVTAPGTENTYDSASQLKKGTGTNYAYNGEGLRTKFTPAAGFATFYTYDQAGRLKSAERAAEGESPAINESYTYDGAGLRASQTAAEKTHYLTWDHTTNLPSVLSDGEMSYVYGPDGLSVEQISGSEVPTYLHHDQLGSTRMLTDAGGEATATFSYAPYGALSGSTGSQETRLGFAGQYTDPGSGLQYLRARYYDPATGQFMTRDPIVQQTRFPYVYAMDDPLNATDPSGLLTVGICGSGSVSIGPLTLGGSACVQASTSGDIGGTLTGGPPGIRSGGLSGGAGLEVTNANHVSELNGPFEGGGASAADGLGGSVEGFTGTTSCGRRVSGVVLGPRAGEGYQVTAGPSYTVGTSVNIPSLLGEGLNAVGEFF